MKLSTKLTTVVVSISLVVLAFAFAPKSSPKDQKEHKAKSHMTLISNPLANESLSQFQQQLTALEHETLSQLQQQLTPGEEQKVSYFNSLDGTNKMPSSKAALFEKVNARQVLLADLYKQFWALHHPAANSGWITALQQKTQQLTNQVVQQFLTQPSGILSGTPSSPSWYAMRQNVDQGGAHFAFTNGLNCLWDGQTQYSLIFGSFYQVAYGSNGVPHVETPVATINYQESGLPNGTSPQYQPMDFSYPPAGDNELSAVGVVGSNAKLTWGQGNVVYFNFVTKQFSPTPLANPTGSCANWSNQPITN